MSTPEDETRRQQEATAAASAEAQQQTQAQNPTASPTPKPEAKKDAAPQGPQGPKKPSNEKEGVEQNIGAWAKAMLEAFSSEISADEAGKSIGDSLRSAKEKLQNLGKKDKGGQKEETQEALGQGRGNISGSDNEEAGIELESSGRDSSQSTTSENTNERSLGGN